MDTTQSPADGAGPSRAGPQQRPKKRVITAARKEQNRLAQKVFRERRKERRQGTTAIASNSSEILCAGASCCLHARHSLDSQSSSTHPADCPDIGLLMNLPLTSATAESNFDNLLLSGCANSIGEGVLHSAPPEELIKVGFDIPLERVQQRILPSDSIQPNVGLPDTGLVIGACNPAAGTLGTLPTFRTVLPTAPLAPEQLVQQTSPYWWKHPDVSAPAVQDDRARQGSKTTLKSNSFNTDQSTISGINEARDFSYYAADPYTNSLQFSSTTVMFACLTNAVCLGFDLAKLMALDLSYQSPFYRPMATARADPESVLTTVRLSIGQVPANLQPTISQVLIPHHAGLDLIPLPRLRDRAILMCKAMPDLFDLWDFKVDIYQHSALTCWRYDRGGAAGAGSDFQPWETRSWEAAPWFLRKWKVITDGEDGELGRQSLWWQAFRNGLQFHDWSSS